MKTRSLRWRLAVLSALAGLVPLAVLLAAVFVFRSDVVRVDTEEVEEEVVVEGPDGTDLFTSEETRVSSLIPLTALVLVVPIVGGAWWWAGRAVRPIVDITSMANDIQDSTLDRRIALRRAPDEVQALGDSFDAMLDRLSKSAAIQRRMLEDTNHELRTPLSALRINTEVMLGDPNPTLDDYRSHAERVRNLVERLDATVESQLASARSQQLATQQVDNDLRAIVNEASVEATELRADVSVDVTGPEQLIVPIESTGMRRAVRNLLDNAVRASPPESVVAVALSENEGRWRLAVTDDGPGIAPADQERVFDRYYTTHPDGSLNHGIGLAVVRQVALAHGDISIESPVAPTGRGTRFIIESR